MIKKEFYLPNNSKIGLYTINYLENDFNLVTDKISKELGNVAVDITDRYIPKAIEDKRIIVIKEKRKSTFKKIVFPRTYRYYLKEDPFLESLTSINIGTTEISFNAIANFLDNNDLSKYLKCLKEYLQVFNFEHIESFSREEVLKKSLQDLENNRGFYRVERYLDQKYFLEIAINREYQRKVENALANKKVLTLGNRIAEQM